MEHSFRDLDIGSLVGGIFAPFGLECCVAYLHWRCLWLSVSASGSIGSITEESAKMRQSKLNRKSSRSNFQRLEFNLEMA
jgi:hypothetical protein